jgi:hypothetical protein
VVDVFGARKRGFPYFKIQQLDERLVSWKSYKNVNFFTEEEAKVFVDSDNSGKELRIVKVDKKSSVPL